MSMRDSVYANALCASLQNKLITPERYARMIDAEDGAEALRVLTEGGFGEGVTVESPYDYERLIFSEEEKLARFVEDFSPSEKFARFALLEYDYFNAETLIKAKYLKFDYKKLIGHSGNINAKHLEELIMSDRYEELSVKLREALLYADDLFTSSSASGYKLNVLFTKNYYSELKELSASHGYLSKVYKALADAANISIAIRSRNVLTAANAYVPQGNLSREDLDFIAERSGEEIRERFKFSERAALILSAADALISATPPTVFEREADGYALKFMKADRLEQNNYEPFILYYYYKKAELRNVRLIMVSKNNGIGRAEIKDSMRECYEG